LLGAGGIPASFDWVAGKEDTRVDAGEDGTFSVRTTKVALLQLRAAPPWPSYRLEAEVSPKESAGGNAGPYFGHQRYGNAPGVQHWFGNLGAASRGPSTVRAQLVIGRYAETRPGDISRCSIAPTLYFPPLPADPGVKK
jgi:hypothetical protein